MVDPDDRFTISAGKDGAKIIEEFDEYFERIDDSYSRAGRVKEAMRFYHKIHEICADMEGVEHPDEMGDLRFRAYVQQAIYDMDGRDRRVEQLEEQLEAIKR